MDILFDMWTIYEKKSFLRDISKIPKHILKNYEVWKRIVELQGLEGLRKIKGYHDESLRGEWHGFRSSRLSLKWRVIYMAKKEVCEIYIVNNNPHKYEK